LNSSKHDGIDCSI